MQETQVQFLFWDDPLKEEMAIHYSRAEPRDTCLLISLILAS